MRQKTTTYYIKDGHDLEILEILCLWLSSGKSFTEQKSNTDSYLVLCHLDRTHVDVARLKTNENEEVTVVVKIQAQRHLNAFIKQTLTWSAAEKI